MSWKALITDKGNALSAKTIAGGGITLTKAKAGTGTVPESNLHSQTDILSVKQILSIENTHKKDNVANVEILLTCRGVETSYDLNQIGIYATDPDDGEILFAIAQSDEGKTIPSESEVSFYSINFNFSFGLENDQSMVATIDQSTFATKEYVEVVNSRTNERIELIEQKESSWDAKSDISLLDVYPVGSIYMSVVNTNPSSLFGGTWVSWGSGRVPVGVNTSDSDFSTVEKTGGAKTVTLTTSQIPAHSHSLAGSAWYQAQGYGRIVPEDYKNVSSANVQSSGNVTKNAGGGGSHNNVQPYITCYMWKRTA